MHAITSICSVFQTRTLQLCREVDQDQLLNLHRQESDFLEAGCLLFAQSFEREVKVLVLSAFPYYYKLETEEYGRL